MTREIPGSTPPGRAADDAHWAARLLLRIGLDEAVAYTVLGRGWAIVAGVVNTVLIAAFLSPTEQGFYYTFSSMLALQVVFELGFGYVIQQFASHEYVHLALRPDGTLSGDSIALSRLSSLARLAVRWYSIGGLLMVAAVTPLGWWFLQRKTGLNGVVDWRVPWFAVVVITGGTLLTSPVFALLEGTGRYAQVARIRLFQSLALGSAFWLALSLHAKLYAAAAASAASFVVGIVWLISRYRRSLSPLFVGSGGPHSINWRTEVLPFQWRIAVSWISGYFIFQLFTPVLFAYRSPQEAGQMGMTLSLAAAVATIAVAWMTARSPRFGQLVAMRRWEELDRLFRFTFVQSTIVVTAGALAAICGVVILRRMGVTLANRMLPPLPVTLLMGAVVCNHIAASQALYLRAHKKEPFLVTSVASAVAAASSAFWLGRTWGATGLLAGYLAIGCVGLAVTTTIYFHRRRAWHASST